MEKTTQALLTGPGQPVLLGIVELHGLCEDRGGCYM